MPAKTKNHIIRKEPIRFDPFEPLMAKARYSWELLSTEKIFTKLSR